LFVSEEAEGEGTGEGGYHTSSSQPCLIKSSSVAGRLARGSGWVGRRQERTLEFVFADINGCVRVGDGGGEVVDHGGDVWKGECKVVAGGSMDTKGGKSSGRKEYKVS